MGAPAGVCDPSWIKAKPLPLRGPNWVPTECESPLYHNAMRILQVLKELKHGGAENVVISLLKGVQAQGHQIAVAATPGEWSDRFPGSHYRLPQTGLDPRHMLAGARGVALAVADFRPDIVHAHNPGIIAATALATRRGRTVPAVGTTHGGVSAATLGRHARLFGLAGLPIISCGPGVTSELQRHRFSPAITIPNGIDLTIPDRRPDSVAVRASLAIPADQPMIVFVGRLTPAKNQQQAIKALIQLPDTRLVLCGDGPARTNLETLAADVGVADRVQFLGMRKDVGDLVRAADALVLTSLYEGLPLTLLESMSIGTPVIATSAIGNRELIDHEVNGLLVPVGDPTALAAAIRQLLSDRELATRLTAGAHATVREYTVTGMVQRHLSYYESTIARHATR